jgi:hypothetical protein
MLVLCAPATARGLFGQSDRLCYTGGHSEVRVWKIKYWPYLATKLPRSWWRPFSFSSVWLPAL